MVTEENNERTNKVIQFFMAIKKKKKNNKEEEPAWSFLITGKFRLERVFIHFGDIRHILGYPHPLPTLFIIYSLTNPWGFASPFSLGLYRGDFGFSREIWIFPEEILAALTSLCSCQKKLFVLLITL